MLGNISIAFFIDSSLINSLKERVIFWLFFKPVKIFGLVDSNLGGIESIGPPGGTLTDAHENNINKYINLFK